MTDIDSDGLLACAADDSATARLLLEEAAERLDEHSGAMSVAEYAQASAAVATGYAQLAALGLNMATAEGAAKQNAQILEMQSVVADAHRAMEDRMRAEQAEIEQRTRKLAELDAATLAASGQRQPRAEAEARPHDDGVVWIAADANGPIHAAVSQALAQAWATDNEGDYEGLSVTAMAVDRG